MLKITLKDIRAHLVMSYRLSQLKVVACLKTDNILNYQSSKNDRILYLNNIYYLIKFKLKVKKKKMFI